MTNRILITGTSRGIGKALKEAFEANGDKVLAHTRDTIGDLRDINTIHKLGELAKENNINVLVNNAGIYSQYGMDEIALETIKDIIEIDLISPILLTRELWPILKENKGTVININSMAGRIPFGGEVAYRAAKFGLTGFSGVLYYEGQDANIRVIDIPLGGVNTDMLKHRDPLTKKEQQPDEVAQVILTALNHANSCCMNNPIINGKIIDNGGKV